MPLPGGEWGVGANEPREREHEEASGLPRGFVQERGRDAERLWQHGAPAQRRLWHIYQLRWGTCEYHTGTHHISKEDSGTTEERHRLPPSLHRCSGSCT